MGKPFTFGHFHIGKDCTEGGILRAAGVDAETDLSCAFKEMADPHLVEYSAVPGTFNAEIILAAAQAVPHGFDAGGDLCGRPVRIAVVCHHASQVLEILVFIFNGAFDPVFTVQVQYYAALIETVMAPGKISPDDKGKEFLVCGHLEHRGIVIAEMIVGPLPQICVGLCHDLDSVRSDRAAFRLSCPFQVIYIKFHLSVPPILFLIFFCDLTQDSLMHGGGSGKHPGRITDQCNDLVGSCSLR